MDFTSLRLCVHLVLFLPVFITAYDFIDAPYELNKLGAVASFPEIGDFKFKDEQKELDNEEKQDTTRKIDIPITTTPSPMEEHARQAPRPTSSSTVDDFSFNDYFPFSGKYSKFDSKPGALQTEDKFFAQDQNPQHMNGDSYTSSKVDGYIMVDGKMQRFSRATSNRNGHPVKDHSTMLKPVTLYVPTRMTSKGEPEMTAVQGYVVGRQGSLGGVNAAPNYGVQDQSKEYTLFVYPEKQYGNKLYHNGLHMPFTTPPPVRTGLFSNFKQHPEMIYPKRISPGDDYRVPSGAEDAFTLRSQNAGHVISGYEPIPNSPPYLNRKQTEYMEPEYRNERMQFSENDYKKARQYDNMQAYDRTPTYSQDYDNSEPSYDNNQRYDNSQSYYDDSQPSQRQRQYNAEPSYEGNNNYNRDNNNYNRDNNNYNGDNNYDGNNNYNNDNDHYNGDNNNYEGDNNNYDANNNNNYNSNNNNENSNNNYNMQNNNKKQTFVQHGPPITRFIPYLNLNGNLIPKYKNGRYNVPSFDVSDSKKGRGSQRTRIYAGAIPVVPYGINPKSIVIVCPRVQESFCKKSGHFGHPTHPTCFVQCDERGVAFVKNCPKDTEWSSNTSSCV